MRKTEKERKDDENIRINNKTKKETTYKNINNKWLDVEFNSEQI